MTIQDFITHPLQSDSSKRLPEVVINGALHGDERVGPTVVMETARLLLAAATCEASLRASSPLSSTTAETNATDNRCHEEELLPYLSNPQQRRWLARLVTTRRIVLVPTANAWGYYHGVRGDENGIDPNRDFPYDHYDPTQCMRTITARALNELFREHMFQAGVVFHGGMEVIAYQWGNFAYQNYPSPDDISQSHLAAVHSYWAGSFPGTDPYPYGRIDQTVYSVFGGMEDWAYATSWDPDRVLTCRPTTYGGYPATHQEISPAALRMFNMLVETSNDKTPTTGLGTTYHVLNSTSLGNGHIPRNIRIALLAIDLVEPYLSFTGMHVVGDTAAVSRQRYSQLLPPGVSDPVPLLDPSSGNKCRKWHSVTLPSMFATLSNTSAIQIEWTVGGALEVNEVALWYAKWENIPKGTLDCLSQPTNETLDWMHPATILESTKGTGTFSPQGPTTFRGVIPITYLQQEPGTEMIILASARVDQSWRLSPVNVRPRVQPQSHLANVRTNADWYFESENNIIQGRLDWFSLPLIIRIESTETQSPLEEDVDIKTLMPTIPVAPLTLSPTNHGSHHPTVSLHRKIDETINNILNHIGGVVCCA